MSYNQHDSNILLLKCLILKHIAALEMKKKDRHDRQRWYVIPGM